LSTPHTAIQGQGRGEIVNLTDHRAEASRCLQPELLASLGPDGIARELSALEACDAKGVPAASSEQSLLPHLDMPAHHDVRPSDVVARRLYGNLAAAADRGPTDFPDLLLTRGVGLRTVRALAMVAEIVHGAPYRFSDPARFSFAHGGKETGIHFRCLRRSTTRRSGYSNLQFSAHGLAEKRNSTHSNGYCLSITPRVSASRG
jgi:uncharacterized protein